MIDIKYIRENPEDVIGRLAAKGYDAAVDIENLLGLDRERRTLIGETEALKAEQNRVTKLIPKYKKEGVDISPVLKKMKELSDSIKENEERLREVEDRFNSCMLVLPNLPDPDLLPGGKENNQPLRYFGKTPKFDFEPKNHVDLCTELGLIDYKESSSREAAFGYIAALGPGLNGRF